jgi:hypothetical protein
VLIVVANLLAAVPARSAARIVRPKRCASSKKNRHVHDAVRHAVEHS